MAGASVGVAAAISIAPPASDVRIREVRLAGDGTESPLGEGTAFVMGATSISTPSPGWVAAIERLYLQPHGFTGTAQPLSTPESLYALTGPFSQTFDASTAQGVQIVVNTVHDQITGGGVDAPNPLLLTGYSQGSAVAALAMPQLAAHGVPSQDVHFLLLGDPSAPNGGYLARQPDGIDPVVPSLGVTFSGGEPSDLYPADVYTMEYDGFADFPQYPINFLSDLNAYLGIVFNHLQYLGLTPAQIHDAVELPTSAADTLTNYYLIPSASLPLLDPLRLVPVVGNPLADLLQPDLRVLVNLGYGSITDGWSPGYADVATPLGFLPPQSVLEQVPEALAAGVQQGINDAVRDLLNPTNYQLVSAETTTAFLGPLLRSAQAEFFWPGASPTEIIDNLIGASGVLTGLTNNVIAGLGEVSFPHTGIPPVDAAYAALITLPHVDSQMFVDQLAAGNTLDAIGEPIALDLGVLPLLLVMAAA